MAIAFSCPSCDRAYTVAEKFAGKVTACKGCQTRIVVPDAEPAASDEDAAFALLAADDGKGDTNPRLDRRSWDAPPPPPDLAPARGNAAEDAARHAEKKAKARRKAERATRDRDDGRGRGGFALSPTMMGGLGTMIVAVVWCGVGLACNVFFIYTPILFVIGLFGFVKGMMGHED